jgi:hypothetical protein
LVAEIETNRTRSRSGTRGFDASSSTRQLKASQESSRLKKRFGPARSASGTSTGAGKGAARKSVRVMRAL